MKNKNIKIIGFFGQSGAGKTTIIRNVMGPINGRVIIQNTGIIRYLFQKNDYYSPIDVISKFGNDIHSLIGQDRTNKIDEIYEKYIRSQFQLLNDFSTEIFHAIREPQTLQTYLLVDRSPIDFYAITVCGIQYIKDKLNGQELNQTCQNLISLVRKTADKNTKNFFDAIFITKPWIIKDPSTITDGVRDQYITPQYTGDNWYGKLDDFDISGLHQFTIDDDIQDLGQRARFVEKCLLEVK